MLGKHQLIWLTDRGVEVAARCDAVGCEFSTDALDDAAGRHLAAVILDLLRSDEARAIAAQHLEEIGDDYAGADAETALDALSDWLGGDA